MTENWMTSSEATVMMQAQPMTPIACSRAFVRECISSTNHLLQAANDLKDGISARLVALHYAQAEAVLGSLVLHSYLQL